MNLSTAGTRLAAQTVYALAIPLNAPIMSAASRGERSPCGKSAYTLTGTSGSKVRTWSVSLVVAAAVKVRQQTAENESSSSLVMSFTVHPRDCAKLKSRLGADVRR